MTSKIGVLSLTVLCNTLSLHAQSTSPWRKVAETTLGDVTAATPGSGYMTVLVRAVTFYQKSNFWTNFVERNRQAVLTVNLDGTIAGVHVTQTKVGNPIELRRNDSLVDLGFSGILVDHLPTTFTGMSMNIQVNKTAQDGLQGLISQVAQMSSTQPPTISVSQQAIGLATLSKSVADFLFHGNLLVHGISSQNPLSAGVLPAGIYVSFAGDSERDYNQYLAAGSPGLAWSGTQLSYNSVPVEKVSYFVIEIAYQSRFFANPLDALSFGGTRAWAALYQLAEREIPTINTATEAAKVSGDVQSHLTDARTLLDNDPDFIQDEKSAIADAVYGRINTAYRARLAAVGIQPGQAPGQQAAVPVAPPPSQPGSGLPQIRPNILVQDDAGITEFHRQVLGDLQRSGTPVPQPTSRLAP